jgi:hypothetical protein
MCASERFHRRFSSIDYDARGDCCQGEFRGQLPLDFSKPPPQSPSSSNSAREVPTAAAPSRYLTRGEAAAYVRCSLRFLDGMGLPFIRKGRCKIYDRIDLDARMQQDKC